MTFFDTHMQPLFSSVYCVDTGAGSGQFNMDFDVRLMRAFADGAFQRAFGEGSCLWRFYAWSPSAVSLGKNQNPAEIDRERRRADGRIVGFRKEHIFYILGSTASSSCTTTVHKLSA